MFCRAVGGMGLVLALAGCRPGEARERIDPAGSDSAATTLASGAPTVAASGSPAPAASPPPSAAATVAPAPTTAPSDRPSARARRPPGADPVQWQRIADIYGHLLDADLILADYHARYPDKTELVTLGTTHEGRPVRALLIADHPARARARPSVLLNGAHHGDEPLSADIVLDAMDTLLARPDSDARNARYLSELAIWCVPMVNPDGFAAFMVDFGAGRKNGRETRVNPASKTLSSRGVDLNRNYPFRWGAQKERGGRSQPDHRYYKGPEPGSEPEVRAMMALSDREHFVGSISYHIGTVALLAPYTIDGVAQPTPNEAWAVAEDIARLLPKNPDKPLYVKKNLYPVDGTDQDYHRAAHGTLALLFEVASRSWESERLKTRTVDAIRPSWGLLFDRYLDGPSVEGHVKDDKGRPVVADVRVLEVRTHDGETWRSRCRDGFFGRYLPGFGRFTVRVTPEGGAPVDTVVEVARGKGRVAVDIVVAAAGGAACPGEAR